MSVAMLSARSPPASHILYQRNLQHITTANQIMNPSNHRSAGTCPSGTIVPTPPESVISIQMPELMTTQLCSGCNESCIGRDNGSTPSISRNVTPDTQECSRLAADIIPGQHDEEKETIHEGYPEEGRERSEDLTLNTEAIPPSDLVTATEALQPQRPAASFLDKRGEIQVGTYLPDQVRRETFSFKVGKYTITAHTCLIARSQLDSPKARGWQIRLFVYLIMIVALVNFLVLLAQGKCRYMF